MTTLPAGASLDGRRTAFGDGPAGMATAGVLLDAVLLSDLVGRSVVATRLRHKPGLSTTAALIGLNGPDQGRPYGWVQVCRPQHLDKVANAMRRAAVRGQHIVVREVPGRPEVRLVTGTIDTDPRLQRGLDAIRGVVPSITEAVDSGRVEVMRYNPHRRLVLRRATGEGSDLLRITARKHDRPGRTLERLRRRGVPVVLPTTATGVRDSRRVTVWPWVGRGDLAALPETRAAGLAGAALARLQSAPARLGRHDHTEPALRVRLVALAEDVRRLDPDAGRRFRLLSSSLDLTGRHAPVLVHGDFSADQVLLDGDGVRVVDLDRMGCGDAHIDLGCFAADQLLRTGGWGLSAPLHAGHGADFDAGALRPWVAFALLARADEPFRSGHLDWLGLLHQRLDQVEAVVVP